MIEYTMYANMKEAMNKKEDYKKWRQKKITLKRNFVNDSISAKHNLLRISQTTVVKTTCSTGIICHASSMKRADVYRGKMAPPLRIRA